MMVVSTMKSLHENVERDCGQKVDFKNIIAAPDKTVIAKLKTEKEA